MKEEQTLHAMRPSLLSLHSTTDGPQTVRASNALIYSNHLTASDNRIIAPLDNLPSSRNARHAEDSRGGGRGSEATASVSKWGDAGERGRKQLTRTVAQEE